MADFFANSPLVTSPSPSACPDHGAGRGESSPQRRIILFADDRCHRSSSGVDTLIASANAAVAVTATAKSDSASAVEGVGDQNADPAAVSSANNLTAGTTVAATVVNDASVNASANATDPYVYREETTCCVGS